MIQYITGDNYNPEHKTYYEQIIPLTNTIKVSYPGYLDWLNNKFFYELKSNQKQRGYVFALDRGLLVGLALLKNYCMEKKLCCLFVKKGYRNHGIAKNLIKHSFDILKTKKPLVTISEQNIDMFLHLFQQFGFEITETRQDMYLKGIKEYYFNSVSQNKR